jgi:ATP-dependent Clp protease ATP-binding subunit ClpA
LFKSFREAIAGPIEMNNFTPRAQQVLALARKEAARLYHNFVGTEHVLLGLIGLGQGTAVNVLIQMGVNLETARAEVEKQFGAGPEQKVIGNTPYTPRVKKVLAIAQREAKALNHTYIGTEHILLGLLGEGDGAAAQVLKNLGVDCDRTRQLILIELDPNCSAAPDAFATPAAPALPSQKPPRDTVDLSKRYDIYCDERNQRVVYRNVLVKGAKDLFEKNRHGALGGFIEIEQADGQTMLLSRFSVIKLCEHGATPGCESVPEKKPES